MVLIKEILLEIWTIFIEMSPYLLLGFFIAGLLHVFLPKHLLTKHLGKPGIISSVKASLLGVPLPLCSCGVIPTGISLYKNGAKKGATNSFLISTPQTGVDSVLITYSLMNIYWALSRPLIAFITGVFGGWFTEKIEKPGTEINESIITEPEVNEIRGNKAIELFRYAFVDFLSDISRQLLLGVLLAALITTLIPDTFFTNYMNQPILNMLIVLVASVPLYVCATGSVPIATALLISGVSPGAVLVFLMAGPATNIATITVLWNSMGKKATLAYLFSIIAGALFFGVLIDFVLNPEWFKLSAQAIAAHNHHADDWTGIISAVLLIGLLLFVEINKLIPRQIKISEMESKYIVEGMTCNHCKNTVETNLSKLDSIEEAHADIVSKSVVIKGEATEDEVKTMITDLGYTYKGIASK